MKYKKSKKIKKEKKSKERKKSKTIKKEKKLKDNGKKQIKFLKSVIEDLINKQSAEIIDLLAGKKHVNEFIIAKNLKLTINQTRNILYKLSDYGLVSFIRKKDKRKGWYIYFWTLNVFQALSLLEENLKKKLGIFEDQLKNRKESRHYVCNTCSIEVNEETALLNDFACPECDEVYELSKDFDVISDVEKKILKLKRELELVSFERDREEQKVGKEKSRKIKKAEAVKKALRKKAAAKRKKEKEKLKKQEEREKGKETVKKTVKKVKKKKDRKRVKKVKKKSKSKIKKSKVKSSKNKKKSSKSKEKK